MSILSEPYFHGEEAAYKQLEKLVWPSGPVCPHCCNADPQRVYRITGKTARMGLRTCAECREQFRVTVGTIFEHSKVPLHKWFQAAHLMASSKKGFSAHQLHRVLKVTYKTAWFMAHRLREAMREGELAPLGGNGRIVEADETYYGKQKVMPVSKHRRGRPFTKRGHFRNNRSIVALVERGGRVRSFHVEQANKETINTIVAENVERETRLFTDESRLYNDARDLVTDHRRVKHARGEYVRYEADAPVHTNSAENVFSVFKRGMRGIYQHCSERHLHRYLAEYDFRYNRRAALGIEDAERTNAVMAAIVGRRLTYRDSSGVVAV